MIRIREATGMDVVRELFREYQAGVDATVCFGTFDTEVAGLPAPYVKLLIAEVDHVPAGCVALKPLEPGNFEVKRLYVRPAFRNLGLGEQLMQAVIEGARSLGCVRLRLDTLPFMARAIALYGRLGFVPIGRYNDNPEAEVLFFEMILHPAPR